MLLLRFYNSEELPSYFGSFQYRTCRNCCCLTAKNDKTVKTSPLVSFDHCRCTLTLYIHICRYRCLRPSEIEFPQTQIQHGSWNVVPRFLRHAQEPSKEFQYLTQTEFEQSLMGKSLITSNTIKYEVWKVKANRSNFVRYCRPSQWIQDTGFQGTKLKVWRLCFSCKVMFLKL